MVKEFNINNKDDISIAIDKLEPKAKTSYAASEIAKMYRLNISSAIKKGYSFKEISQVFNSNNCDINAKELEIAYKKLRGNIKTKPVAKKSNIDSQHAEKTTINN